MRCDKCGYMMSEKPLFTSNYWHCDHCEAGPVCLSQSEIDSMVSPEPSRVPTAVFTSGKFPAPCGIIAGRQEHNFILPNPICACHRYRYNENSGAMSPNLHMTVAVDEGKSDITAWAIHEHIASRVTGRWSGKMAQPQTLRRAPNYFAQIEKTNEIMKEFRSYMWGMGYHDGPEEWTFDYGKMEERILAAHPALGAPYGIAAPANACESCGYPGGVDECASCNENDSDDDSI